jgi:hypothetical protein
MTSHSNFAGAVAIVLVDVFEIGEKSLVGLRVLERSLVDILCEERSEVV